MTAAIRRTVAFPGISMDSLQAMLGAYNGHLKQIEQRLDVKIAHRGDSFTIDGGIDEVERAEMLLQRLHEESESSLVISSDVIHLMIQEGASSDKYKKELIATAEKLQSTLDSFGVSAKVVNVSRGPAVTRYELAPDPGVKVSKIVNLTDDIALNLAAPSIRM